MVVFRCNVQKRHFYFTQINGFTTQREGIVRELIVLDEIAKQFPCHLSRDRQLVGGPPIETQLSFDKRVVLDLDLKEDLTKLQLRWFDRWLKDAANGIDEEPPVKLFIQGRNRWRDESAWPLARAVDTPWFLGDYQGLSRQTPAGDSAPDSFVYDPNDPCPICGGGTLLPPQYVPGPVDQAPILGRRDVLCYTSAPLNEDLEITGAVTAVLYAATSGRDTDWVVKLCDVRPDGKTLNVCDGVLRASVRDGANRTLVEPNTVIRYDIDLWSTAMLFKAGHGLRVLVTSSDFPRYDRNPNTGELAHTATHLEPALQRIYHDAERASHLVLPIVS